MIGEGVIVLGKRHTYHLQLNVGGEKFHGVMLTVNV